MSFVLNLDMDDVVTDTNTLMVNDLITILKDYDHPAAEYLLHHLIIHDDLHTLAFQERLRKHAPELGTLLDTVIKTAIMDKGCYMTRVKPNYAVVDYIRTTLAKAVEGGRIELAVTTHRGFHVDATDLTKAWLREQKVEHLINDFNVLDYRTIPNKLIYLRERYGDNFLLVDDNPIAGTELLPHHKELVIYTNGRKHLSRYTNQAIVNNVAELHAHLIELGVIGYY